MKSTVKTWILCCLLLLTSHYFYSQTPGFVYAEGEKFMLDGNPYYFSGANVYDFFTYGSSSGDIETQFMDKDRIDAHMRTLYENGVRVARIWGFSHEDWHGFEPQKGVYSEGQFSLFDYVVKSAEANGVKLIVALENYWNDYGGIRDRLKWEGIDVEGAGTHDQGQFFTNAPAIQGFKDYVEYFITRKNHYDGVEYRDDPTILAWELMNEPRYQTFGDDLTSDTLRAWVDDMGQFIKGIDSKHLLGTGLEGHGAKYNFGGDEGNDFIKIHQSPYIDFTSAHPYIRESWSNFTLEETMQLVCQWADESHRIINKPLYVGEFNVERNERLEWWEEIYGFIEEKQIGASAFWWFPDSRTPRDKFAVFEGDTELDIYKEHAFKMEEMSGGEAIYLSLMSPKSGDKYVSGSEVHIEANLMNENNTVAKVTFYSNGFAIGEDTTAPYQLDVSGLDDGTYRITSIATSVSGVTKESTPRNIQIGGEGIVTLEYRDGSSGIVSNEIKPLLKIFNNSSQDIAYEDLSVRYWFEKEDDMPINFSVDYAELGNSNISGDFVNYEGDSYYLEIAFDALAGALGRNADSGRIEAKITNSDYSQVNQANDYSFDATKQEFTAWDKIGLYLNGKLVSGVEPGTTVDTPVAVAIASVTSGNGPLLVSFDASGSTDPNGDALTYTWGFENGTTATGITIDNEFTEFGNHVVTLTVNDGNGNTDSTTLTITVTNPNLPPVALFTNDVNTGIVPALVVFDASGSTDPNGDALTYTWDFGNGDTTTGVTTSYEFTSIGDFEVTLTVSDGNLESSIVKRILITDGTPIASIVIDRMSGFAPLEVVFDASDSVDPSNNALSYAWDFGDGTSGSGVNITHTFTTVGQYNVLLTIDNGQGGIDVETKIITVSPELVVSDISVEYKDGGNGSVLDNMINPHLRIVNNGSEPLNYNDITIRYWFTSDSNDLNFWCDWAQLGTSNVTGIFGQANGMNYLEIAFNATIGTLAGGNNSGDIQTRFAKSNWSNFSEDDDYSYDITKTSYSSHNEVTLYNNGTLVWGVEPVSSKLANIDLTSEFQIKVFPNPVVSEITIASKSDLKGANVRLVDLAGKELYREKIEQSGNSMRIDMNAVVPGVYFIQIEKGTEVVVKQIVKQ